jgi:hypothetical protein
MNARAHEAGNQPGARRSGPAVEASTHLHPPHPFFARPVAGGSAGDGVKDPSSSSSPHKLDTTPVKNGNPKKKSNQNLENAFWKWPHYISAPGWREMVKVEVREKAEHHFYGRYRGHEIGIERDGRKTEWYIIVTAPDGTRAYDGWFKGSVGMHVNYAIYQALEGSLLLPKKIL